MLKSISLEHFSDILGGPEVTCGKRDTFYTLSDFYSGRREDNTSFSRVPKERVNMLLFLIIQIIVADREAVFIPDYSPINQVLGRNEAIENYFTPGGFCATEILSFLLNVHRIHLNLN